MARQFLISIAATMAVVSGCGTSEKPIPEETACHAGGYRLEDGRVVGMIPRDPGDMRYQFVSGETGTVLERDGGFWRGSGDDAATIRLGVCGDPTIDLNIAGETIRGTKIPYSVTETIFDGVDGKRAGRLVLPADQPTKAIVVSVHGSERWSGRIGGRLQTLLPAFGIGVFAYDKRGTGTSEGKYTQDFDILAGDALRARREARRLFGRDIDIGYIGGSQGGWVAPYAASKDGAAFVIAAYGMAIGPLYEDREEVFKDLRDAGYGEDVIEKASEITDATGLVIKSGFKDGFDELDEVREKYQDEEWYDVIEGEFTGQFLGVPNIGLRIVGPFRDVGTSWEYEPRPVIEELTMPQLWILADDDRAAPSGTTLEILRDIQTTKDSLDVVVFPNTDHGILEFIQNEDGTRTYTRTAEGYYALIRDFILTREPTLTVQGPILYEGQAAAETGAEDQ
ncbi:MAG: alpha/beta hydrolase [Pseudomonadota bacterium]